MNKKTIDKLGVNPKSWGVIKNKLVLAHKTLSYHNNIF
jgi:hypothetical protein